MTADLINDLQYLAGKNPNLYVFGNEMCPGSKPVFASKFTKSWNRLRREINLPDEMQLYSLRDTAMTEMIKSGIDPLTVKQLADHHSLDMTTIYTNHVDSNMIDIIYNNAPKF
ncbi:MAG: tyrosine-type recombinase/integrase [Bacteroidales bacterium]|nr:site-specific integrase [Bacteroidales bacterium]MDD2205661.1 tyrosine-type recombinase/integrase [Bacteroidales bacterium]MDD3153045.1 tyrosine-type recombinase/integrase [Bacteroidales bacterium]MDD3915119.1 tyrosine-type recombinase/integrase [Bacteroidales bacterium]MDD4634893.1 tyrosine-type recombinase/integrase [Bacteroidales bacterium]